METGAELFRFRFNEPARAAKFSVGEQLAAVSTDPFMNSVSTIRIFNIEADPADQSDEEVIRLTGPRGRITRVHWVDENRGLLSASEDGCVRRWDVETGKCVAEAKLHEKQIGDMQMSGDGTHFITASTDRTAKLVDTQAGVGVGVERGGGRREGLALACNSTCTSGRRQVHQSATAGAPAGDGSALGAKLQLPGRRLAGDAGLGAAALKPHHLQTFEQLKVYKSAAPINSAALSPIFDHVLIGGGQVGAFTLQPGREPRPCYAPWPPAACLRCRMAPSELASPATLAVIAVWLYAAFRMGGAWLSGQRARCGPCCWAGRRRGDDDRGQGGLL